MNISRKKIDENTVLISVSSKIDHQDRDVLENFILNALEEKCSIVYVDVASITYLSSADISVFVNVFQKAETLKKKVILCNPSDIILKIIDFTNSDFLKPHVCNNFNSLKMNEAGV